MLMLCLLTAIAFSTSYQLVQWFRHADVIGLGLGGVGTGPIALLMQVGNVVCMLIEYSITPRCNPSPPSSSSHHIHLPTGSPGHGPQPGALAVGGHV
jgi:hypothetical protein